jgi:hypothetical protein
VTTTDKTYADAAAVAMGRTLAGMYLGMIREVVPPYHAVEVMKAYVQALALRPAESPPQKDTDDS